MEKCFVGLDVSKEETSVCVCNQSGDVLPTARVMTGPDAILRALSKHTGSMRCVVLETGRMANWLYNELCDRGLPMVCIDARQAHAVLSQMHNWCWLIDVLLMKYLNNIIEQDHRFKKVHPPHANLQIVHFSRSHSRKH